MTGISIVICARNNQISDDLRNNIETTIGVNHEIIIIDNSQNRLNIFQAYNKGVQVSKMPIICFMHDDVRFHTQDWGNRIENHFESSDVGMIGVAGPTYLSAIPGVWWGIDRTGCENRSIRQINIDTDRTNPKISAQRYINPLSEEKSEVVILDGLFFCIRKNLFEKINFDETFGGFHFYDLDISLQVRNLGYRLYCIYDVLIEHISVSSINLSWSVANRMFYDKWHAKLPQSVVRYAKREIQELEYNNIDAIWKILGSLQINPMQFFSMAEKRWLILHLPSFFIKKIINRLKVSKSDKLV